MANILRRLDDEHGHKVRELDKDCKEKFRWAWFDKIVNLSLASNVTDERKIGAFFQKICQPGLVICTICLNKTVNYASRGIRALIDHAQCEKHKKNVVSSKRTHTLHSHFGSDMRQDPPSRGSVDVTVAPIKLPALMCDRVSTAEATVLGFITEHNLPLDIAPDLVDLSKTLADDKRALGQVKLSRWTASYKLNYGLGEHFLDETLDNIRKYPFSLNLDESTSNNNKRVLAILVSYFKPEAHAVVVEYLASVDLIKVDTISVYNALIKLFDEHTIPWENLVSMLMDSCNVMRGSKNGLETRVRQLKAPNLLDIDGDSCHHIHNCAKRFCAPFTNYIEGLFTDVFNDCKWSSDVKEYLSEICEFLSVKFSVPANYVPHRWLSVYDIALSTKRLLDAYVVLYYAFLKPDMKACYKDQLEDIIRSCSKVSKSRIREIQEVLSKKKMTEEGKNRKQRIVEKLLFQHKQTCLTLNFYIATLAILKSYVCVFQGTNTLVHQLHEKQLSVFTQFLALFIKPEHIVSKSPTQLKALVIDPDDTNKIRIRKSYMFVGGENETIIKKSREDDQIVNQFLARVVDSYVACAAHMQKRLPLDSDVLQSLACLDPLVRSHSRAGSGIRKLVNHLGLGHILSETEQKTFSLELLSFQVDAGLPHYLVDSDAVQWWSAVMATGKYPALSKIAAAGLGVFHGPQVESSFSVMNNVIDSKRNRLNLDTYSAYQFTKYSLRAKKMSTIEYLRRSDVQHSPVNKRLCHKMRSAGAKFKAKKAQTALMKKERLQAYKISLQKPISNEQARLEVEQKEKDFRLAHEQQQKNRDRKRALEELVCKRKAAKLNKM